jgi:hypothetical protein
MPETAQPVGKDMIPFYDLCKNPQVWADDFCKMEAAQIEFQKLEAERKEIRKAPRTKSDQKKIIKTAYDQYIINIGKQLAGLFANQGPNTFDRLPHLLNNSCNSYLPKEIIESALEQLPPDPPDALSDEQKKKSLDSIKKRMDAEKAKIKKYTPQSYLLFKNGNVKCDSRAEFVRFWRNKQTWIRDPITIQGMALEHGTKDEKYLYEKLKIANSILSKATKLAYHP